MKKIIFVLVLLLFTIGVSAVSPIPYLTAADQYYSVIFDEEGEGIVSLYLTIRNADTEPIDLVNLEIPGNFVTVLGVMQETTGSQSQTCIRWQESCVEYGDGQTCVQYDYYGNCIQYETPCLKYGSTCAQYQTDYLYQVGYQKIQVEPVRLANSLTVPIKLVTSLKENGQTNILILYKVQDYVAKSMGAYKIDFETAKVAYTTNNVRVAINVQNNLYLKGGQSQINYLPSFGAFSNALEASADMSISQRKMVADYAQQITYAPGLVKSATYLDPHESFSVSGTYSRSWLRLYWGRIFLISMAILAVIIFLFYGVKKLMSYGAENIPQKVLQKQTGTKHNFIIPFLAGLFTSIAMVLVWVVTILLISLASGAMGYGTNQMFAMLFVLFAILITLALLIGVPVYTGNRWGASYGLFTVLSILGWMFIFMIILFFIIGFFTSSAIVY